MGIEEDLDRYEATSSIDEDLLIPEPEDNNQQYQQQQQADLGSEEKLPKFLQKWSQVPGYKKVIMKSLVYQKGCKSMVVKAYLDASQRVREDAILAGLLQGKY